MSYVVGSSPNINLSDSVYLGVSVGRPYYSERHIHEYCAWANYNCKRFAFLVGDSIYKYTSSVLHEIPLEEAARRAETIGKNICIMIHRASSNLKVPYRIFRWRDIECFDQYSHLVNILSTEYEKNCRFRSSVRDQVFRNLGTRISAFGITHDVDHLTGPGILLDRYVIEEITGLITMSEHAGYPTEVYPGDDLEIINAIYDDAFPSISRLLPNPRQRKFYQLTLA